MKLFYRIEEKYYPRKKIEECTGHLDEFVVNKLIEKKENEDRYKFNYVGVIVDKGYKTTSLTVILPKYLEDIGLGDAEKKSYTQLLIQVFKQYAEDKRSKRNDYLEDLDDIGKDTHFNFLSVIDYLINDYLKYGLYSNDFETHEYNGNGLIDWNKTINEEYAFISNRQAIYADFFTRTEENDENDYIRQIHHNIIYKSFELFQKISFFDFFEYPSLYISKPKTIIQNEDFQLKSIDLEMGNIFSERKIKLLKTMKYFLEKESIVFPNNIILYGTKSFESIWEETVAKGFGNQYDYYKTFIKKPNWKHHKSGNDYDAKKTLEPDTIRRIGDNMFIIDAKYYRVPFSNTGELITKQSRPGIQDISKQYLYVIALKNNLSLSSYGYYNSFIMPTPYDDIRNIGEVKLDFFSSFPKIQIILFPAKRLFEMYISGTVLTDREITSELS